ncbi:L-type lectin-domain containing receptor kinase IV.1 [Dendrobium catenatum]|uniref:non-specific serine/threonine protein kinase n=2 Tax=Dendrobium catenatum TaxID=906689 RepID=A0A2I0XFY1_9ASPA|nr:L-type lectin-domain containing receptor kinase IV.1 [Dendrobium catenatum]
MSNGSLDKFIYDETGKKKLNWNQRLSIIKGVASALLYIHEEFEQVVIHRDVKASNVLLDEELNAKLGDFRLSRLYDHGSDSKTTRIVGTMGYIAPELNKTGKVSTCTDVYAFGFLLLEVVCGRRSLILQEDYSNSINLVDYLHKSLRRRTIMESWSAEAGSNSKPEEIELVLRLGLLCSHHSDKVRPNMRQEIQILEGDLLMPEVSDVSSNL